MSEAGLVEIPKKDGQKVKCIVWDLDNTLWDGILLEDENVALKDGVIDILDALDSRGILQSVASKNEHNSTVSKLKELGIYEYFLYPQINWSPKSQSIKKIAELINIGVDTFAFVDDQAFERDEVAFSVPGVLCIDALELTKILDLPEMNPRFITTDSKLRRRMYLSDMERNRAEEDFEGAKEEFLAALGMKFVISPVGEDDLKRAEELTVRTHQLNTTGYTYSYEELDRLRKSQGHKLLIASLDDKYGTYGKIGLALIQCGEKVWTLKLVLMSCRVMSRGVGTILINYILQLAKNNGVVLRAEFVPTDRNRMMFVTYKFAGFVEKEEANGLVILENDLSRIQSFPAYVDVKIMEQ
jgi:FkbH-like protein